MASLLASLDVMVNPSLRAWSETLCIANVEAMAMRLPVVTFGVGGVGEYVRGAQTAGSLTRPECHDQRSLGAADLSGTAGSCPVEAPASRPLEMNSVVAASGTAEGLASGVLWLLENATRREAIGRRAQATVSLNTIAPPFFLAKPRGSIFVFCPIPVLKFFPLACLAPISGQ